MQAINELSHFLAEDQIRTDQDSIATYAKDWTTYYQPDATAILFPRSTEEVQSIVKWSIKNKMNLVPSGGRTGLSAAAVAKNKEVVVSFEKMNKILEWSEIDRIVSCQAGVVTEELQKFVTDKGYLFPVDFASRGSSQIGGNIATNAGGIKVIRYGLIRDWISGLTVVTGAGDILQLNNGLIKNACGYDLRHLFVGSEGTLGFVCEAEMRVTRQVAHSQVLLMSVPKLEHVMQIYSEFMNKVTLQAFEFLSDQAMKLVTKHSGLSMPLSSPGAYYVLLEIEDETGEFKEALEGFENSLEKEWVTDGVMSQSAQQAKDLWRLREDISEAASAHSPYRNDISVRISKIPPFLQDIDKTLTAEYPNFEVIWFGHIGDGNLHLDILKPKDMPNEEFLTECRRVDSIVFNSVEKFGGSVSAEHGVGLTKKPHLHHTRSSHEIELFRSIKQAFDPHGILNPGKVFDS